MADAVGRSPSPKRLHDGDGSEMASRRPRRPYKHHHLIRSTQQPTESREPAFVDPETIDRLVLDAIKYVVEEEGAKLAIYDPVIESLALTAFRNAVEECELSLTSLLVRC
jgi:hypothetical protein